MRHKDHIRPVVKVAAAIITRGSKILITRRRHPPELAGLWEFPGGKAMPGESLEQCLAREIMEELCLVIDVGRHLGSTTTISGGKTLEINFFEAAAASGEIVLHDHSDARWIEPEQLPEFAFAPADRSFVGRILQGGIIPDHPFRASKESRNTTSGRRRR